MNDLVVGQVGCRCAAEYGDRWPDMTAAELAHVHDPSCGVRLRRRRRERQRARAAGAAFWESVLREQQGVS